MYDTGSSMAKVEHDTATYGNAYVRVSASPFCVSVILYLAITLLMTNRFEQRKQNPLEYNVFAII